MKTLQELGEQTNKARVSLLLADAQMALTLLDMARGSKKSELRKRRTDEALKAYSFIRDRMPTVSLTPSETDVLNKKMALLKLRLSLS
jgi:hypothetical protein